MTEKQRAEYMAIVACLAASANSDELWDGDAHKLAILALDIWAEADSLLQEKSLQ